jgi:uroporphyrinogen decarboxylase
MNRKQVANSISRKGQKGLPRWCHWYAKETEKLHGEILENFKEEFPDDILTAEFLPGQPDIAPFPYWYGGLDEFGCLWNTSSDSVGAQIIDHPLKNWDTFNDYLNNEYPLIEKDTQNRFSQASELREKYPDRYIAGKSFRVFFERMYMLRGMDQLFLDFYLYKEQVLQLAKTCAEFVLDMIPGWKSTGVDAVFVADDWGFQDNLMIPPELWREIFKPWYKRIFDEIHNHGMQVWFHSCGNIYTIINDLLECGLDLLNPIQPHALSLESVSHDFRGRLSFHGGMDTGGSLIHGNQEMITAELTKLCEWFATPSGGYIMGPATTIMPNTPIENIETFLQVAWEISGKQNKNNI